METVQDMRYSSSNPVSCSETSIKIYGSKEEIRARKSPETVDAPGFAPDASIPVILYGKLFHSGYFALLFSSMSFRQFYNICMDYDSDSIIEILVTVLTNVFNRANFYWIFQKLFNPCAISINNDSSFTLSFKAYVLYGQFHRRRLTEIPPTVLPIALFFFNMPKRIKISTVFVNSNCSG